MKGTWDMRFLTQIFAVLGFVSKKEVQASKNELLNDLIPFLNLPPNVVEMLGEKHGFRTESGIIFITTPRGDVEYKIIQKVRQQPKVVMRGFKVVVANDEEDNSFIPSDDDLDLCQTRT
jgi:hypothetical protein